MINTQDVHIENISVKNGTILDPFEEFIFSFEISNNSDKTVTFNSNNDIIVTLSNNSEVIYKRSLRLPVTSGELIRAMSIKRNVDVLKPFTIQAKSKQVFTFSSFNTMPLIMDKTLYLMVIGVTSDGAEIKSKPISLSVAQFTIVESNRTFMAEYINVLANPVIFDSNHKKRIAFFYSNHPVFEKITTYYQHEKYPNYESIYAVFSCNNDIIKTIPVTTGTSETASNFLFLSLLYPNRVEIIKILKGGHKIISEYEKFATVKTDRAAHVLKIKQYYNYDKIEFCALLDSSGQNSVHRIYKTMFGWEILMIKSKVNLHSMEFEKINPVDLVQ